MQHEKEMFKLTKKSLHFFREHDILCSINKTKYEVMNLNYQKLRKRIKEVFPSEAEFARAIGLGRTAFSSRINNKTQFKQNEILLASELLNIKMEEIDKYFFTPLVR